MYIKEVINKKRRLNFKKYEQKMILYKFIIYNQKLSLKIRYYYMLKLNKFLLKYSSSRIYNMCILTRRKRGIVSDFKISRIMFRHFVLFGRFAGIRKAI